MSISQHDATELDYPTSDGKPMAETERHRDEMMDLIWTLQRHFAGDPMVCVSGNLLLFYEEGNKRKHISPDVFVVRGVPKRERLNYLVWREGKGPDFVIELTSKSTRAEDRKTKLALYRDVLHVSEYILFDPLAEYLRPPLQGFRLVDGEYTPIAPVAGRLPSAVLGLHLERDGQSLRLVDPATAQRLLTPRQLAEAAEAELARLRDELEALRRRPDEP
ncbi:MAG TPA: Uma2 family endonuclease [Isosphaeraceae bacterium]|jgi:Uma2 family endonuclease|nr:Uma2 family endonuclease [Isosphaeraceae bacterium]